MSTTIAAPAINGNLPPSSQPVNEVLQYEKILKLRDEVFAGSHPRLRLPAHAVKIVSPKNSQGPSHSQVTLPPAPPPVVKRSNQLPGLQSRYEGAHALNENKVNRAVPSTLPQPTSKVSEFDPVLLTKSDDLVRAETQLQRQRLEKALRDQFEQKRLDARKRPAPAEAKPDFDITALFNKAMEIPNPPAPREEGSASDSFDENSFYSSRAPDSTPERGAPTLSPQNQAREDADDFDADGPSGPRIQSAVMGSPFHPDLENDTSPRVAPFAAQRIDNRLQKPNHGVGLASMEMVDDDDEEEEEEGEYSPPEAMEQYHTPNETGSQMMHDSRDPRSRPLRRYSEIDENGKRPGSLSEPNMRIVRNHITSPIAPQPARVSPLAVAKEPPLLQNPRLRKDRGRQQQAGRPGSPRQSPEPSQQYPARKKRRLEKKTDRKLRRNGGLSPDTFIKEENVSPPPFHDVQPLGSARLRPTTADRPVIIDDDPVENIRYAPVSDRYLDAPARPLSRQLEPPVPLSEPRLLPRGVTRSVREDQDLRRVASMHNMRTEQPRDYAEPVYETPTRTRATPYARVGSPMITEDSRVIQDIPSDYGRMPLQEVRMARSPAPVYREAYEDSNPEVRYQNQPMPAPPLERIVVDQYGRRFREILQPERRSVAPRATPMRIDPDAAGYEGHRGGRGNSVYADAAPDRRYGQDMPPPPSTYRQVAEAPRNSGMPGSANREGFDYAPIQRSASVQVIDRSSRQPVYVDDEADYRVPPRVSSVRPPMSRYEDIRSNDIVPRGSSVRPLIREPSVMVEERSQPRREYLPVEQPRYRVIEPEERFYDAQGREVIVDSLRDGRQRMIQRY